MPPLGTGGEACPPVTCSQVQSRDGGRPLPGWDPTHSGPACSHPPPSKSSMTSTQFTGHGRQRREVALAPEGLWGPASPPWSLCVDLVQRCQPFRQAGGMGSVLVTAWSDGQWGGAAAKAGSQPPEWRGQLGGGQLWSEVHGVRDATPSQGVWCSSQGSRRDSVRGGETSLASP